jgi:hypothetical protein
LLRPFPFRTDPTIRQLWIIAFAPQLWRASASPGHIPAKGGPNGMIDFLRCRQTRLKSMTNRRQALCSREPLATSIFLILILVFIFALPSSLVRAEPSSSGASAAVDQGDRVTPDDMNTGALLLRNEDGGFAEAPRLATNVMM